MSQEEAPGSELRAKPKGTVDKPAWGPGGRRSLALFLKSAVTAISHWAGSRNVMDPS